MGLPLCLCLSWRSVGPGYRAVEMFNWRTRESESLENRNRSLEPGLQLVARQRRHIWHNAAGIKGTTDGWDWLNISGILDLSNLSAESKFNINMWSLASLDPDVSGDAINFINTQNYRWTIATAAGGITNFSASYFNLFVAPNNGAGGFSNDLGGGLFTLETQGNNLDIVFTSGSGPGPEPIPEPGTWAAALLLLGAAAFARWRRRQTA